MAHLRLLGIQLVSVDFFRLQFRIFGLSRVLCVCVCVCDSFTALSIALFKSHFDKTHNSKYLIGFMRKIRNLSRLPIHSHSFYFTCLLRFAWEQKHFYNVIYNGNILCETHSFVRSLDWVILIFSLLPLETHRNCIWNIYLQIKAINVILEPFASAVYWRDEIEHFNSWIALLRVITTLWIISHSKHLTVAITSDMS